MAWDPPVDLGAGDPRRLKVSASDVANNAPCGRFLALKVRPQVKQVDGWSRLFPPRGEDTPFPLADVTELVMESHGVPGLDTWDGLHGWLVRKMESRGVHRLLRPYVEQAVENVLDAHEVIEGELGPLRLLRRNPEFGADKWSVNAWAPLYENDEGVREIRRLRLGTAHDSDEDGDLWAGVAAHVACTSVPAAAPSRVRVVEIGCVDGNVTVLFDGPPEEATALYEAEARGRARTLVEEDHVVPCRSCGECKTAGSCGALVPLDGLLGQPKRGHRSRSVSPSALKQYVECPGQWLLDSCSHLPKDRGGSEALDRGRYVHQWLDAAHRRGTGCEPDDLPAPGGGLGLAEGVLDAAQYSLAYPYLVHHVGSCPLADPAVVLVAVEDTVHGYDHEAEVVAVTRPDLLYRRDDGLVVREFKTSAVPYANGRDTAFDRHLQVPFALRVLQAGLLAQHGATTGTVEVELLTPDGQHVWDWRTDSAATMAVAAGEIERITDEWHDDSTWDTTPGPQCGWCPVRDWCPDRDVWEMSAPRSLAGADPGTPAVFGDVPPF